MASKIMEDKKKKKKWSNTEENTPDGDKMEKAI